MLKIRKGTVKPSAGGLENIFQKYVREIRNLALLMDTKDFVVGDGT